VLQKKLSTLTLRFSMSSSFQDVLDLFKAIPLVTYGVGIAQDMILSVMKNGPVPRHVALIMDGNRTFARNNKLPLKDGHNAGAQTLVQVSTVYRESTYTH
jgi:ditrans,polycis-polyprenyl diphosphate synthase